MIAPTLQQERALWHQGYQVVAGVDEVGRGAWAGPVVAAAVILNPEVPLPRQLRDSKQLTPRQRRIVWQQLQPCLNASAIGQAEVAEIQQLGIVGATCLAMTKALAQLPRQPDWLLVDGTKLDLQTEARTHFIVRGDSLVASIAAASIVAKVYRDDMMAQLDPQFPQYGLSKHKGYGTLAHQAAIRTYGLSSLHRPFNLKFLSDSDDPGA